MISCVMKLLFIHSSELNITVENKSCRLLRKSRSFALNNDIKLKSNPVTEIDIYVDLGFVNHQVMFHSKLIPPDLQ